MSDRVRRGLARRLGVAAVAVGLFGSIGVGSAAAAQTSSSPHQASGAAQALGPERRAALLVAQMTLDEKISMVHGDPAVPAGTAGYVPGVPRLGIPPLYLTDGPNGVGNGSTGVTAFPVAVTTAATWDRAMADAFGTALGAEQLGKGHNVALAPTLNILRTPLWGREAETYTEDPYLNGQTAAAEVRGIQHNPVIATPKHFVANNQETGRFGVPVGGTALNEIIPERALQEIYYPGFKAAVQQGGAGSVMCAYQRVNGEYACQNRHALQTLEQQWGFKGYVVADWIYATRDTVAAAKAGLDLEMPGGEHFGDPLKAAVLAGQVPMSTLDEMVRRILTAMIRLGLFDHPVNGVGAADVSTPAHMALARQIAEQGSVLLKNRGVLPLDTARVRSLAVIGDAAGAGAQLTEGGSGAVIPSHVVTPIDGIRARAGSSVNVTYAPGTLGVAAPLPLLTGDVVHTPSGQTGLLGTYYASGDWTGAPFATRVDASADVRGIPVAGLPFVWSARWTGALTPPTTGEYRFSVAGSGGYTLWVNGKRTASLKYADAGMSLPTLQPPPVRLTAGVPVSIRLDYTSAPSRPGGNIHLGWALPTPQLRQAAIDAARSADVAVVFISDKTAEGWDRPDLSLPGDDDELVRAIARVNPRTVVVLNTGGPVLTPWLSQVAGVIETWYPGQEYGDAIAHLLFGDVNPSGKLPMTWPATSSQGPASDYRDLHIRQEQYREGILVGYRWYDATGERPLFPFGYGLSYTTFHYDRLHIASTGKSYDVSLRVTNTGRRTGAEVVQLYLGDPAAAQEPPKQLKGYAKVTLRPGQSTSVRFQLHPSDIAVWHAGKWTVVPGIYRVLVGSSSRDIRVVDRLYVH